MAKFDKVAYQRDYMRRRRSGEPNRPVQAGTALKRRPEPTHTSKLAAEPKRWMPGLEDIAALVEASNKHARHRPRSADQTPFKFPEFPKDAVPPGGGMAMDNALCANNTWGTNAWMAGAIFDGAGAEGLIFPGYAYLSQLAQVAEYRTISETIADDSTRRWIDFEVAGDENENRRKAEKDPVGEAERMADPDERKKRVASAGKTDKVKALKDDQERLCVRDRFYTVARDDGFFGRMHLFLQFGAEDTGPELKHDIGDGRGALSKSKVKKNSFKLMKAIEPIWVYPQLYNATNPMLPNWYDPSQWYVMGQEVHRSRLLPFVGHPVPDMLKPAYSFGGLSMSQMAKPYVDIWLRTRSSVAEMIHAFSIMVLLTDLSTLLAPGGATDLLTRVMLFNAFRDNQGAFVANKATEDVKNVSAPLGGLDHLQAQAQEHMCLPGTTEIETARGSVRIDEITLADEVWTRAGLCPIKWVGVTDHVDTLIEIEAGNSVLMATAEHPVWLESTTEFASAQYVSTSDRLLALEIQSPENMGHLSRGAATGGGRPNAAITAMRRLADSFIASCGLPIEAISRKAMTFTTPTMMGQTTDGTTLNFSPAPSTSLAIRGSGSMPTTEPTLRNANFAEGLSKVFSWAKGLFSAPDDASKQLITSGTDARSTLDHVRHVEKHSHLSASERRASARVPVCSVPVSRVSAIKVPYQPVYNIEVDGPPEFFANGLLVHNSAVSRIPLVKLTGISPSGLNATSEQEIEVYDDTIAAYQNRFMRPNLTRIVGFEQLSLFGEVDPEITTVFEKLRSATPKEQAELQKMDAERHQVYVDLGAISNEDVRKIIVNDPELPYTGLDPDDVPDLEEEEAAGLIPKGTGGGVGAVLGEGEEGEQGPSPEVEK